MKKYFPFAIIVVALLLIGPNLINAEDNTADNSNSLSPTPSTIREKIRSVINQNIPERKDTLMERKSIASSTRAEVKDIRDDTKENIKNASSSIEKREIKKDMRLEVFKIKQEALVKQLRISLTNLNQVRSRMITRIEKATQSGRDMTKAKAMLVIADAKIVIAKNAIDAVASYSATSTNATSTSAGMVDLMKPRLVGDTAIKAIGEAKKALNDVVVAIAKAMGINY